jgi:hypothetical protein
MDVWTRPGARVSPLLAAFALIVATSGCQTFQPVETVEIGQEVRARLTAAEAIRQSELTGEPVRVLEGTVSGMDEGSFQLDVVTARGQRLTENFRFTTPYTIPLDEVEELSLRRLSPWRTGVTVALLGAGLYFLLDQTVAGGGNTNENGGPPPNPADWIVRFIPSR